MVSLILLTTEEVLEKNGFWYRLDSIWIAEELEPFAEVNPEQNFLKPLSRDSYYAKYPDITRSESEDDGSITISGFKRSHYKWKSRISLNNRSSMQSSCSRASTSNTSINNASNPKINTSIHFQEEKKFKSNDERVQQFMARLVESIPPPPEHQLYIVPDQNIGNGSVLQFQNYNDMCDINIPNYEDFETEKMKQSVEMPNATSTLKRKRVLSTCSLDNIFEHHESWCDSIFGVGNSNAKSEQSLNRTDQENVNDYELDAEEVFEMDSESWTDIIQRCGLNSSIFNNSEYLVNDKELTVSESHTNNIEMTTYSDNEESEEENAYAKFAIYKIYKTLQIDDGLIDSSSLKDVDYKNDENLFDGNVTHNKQLFGEMYSLVKIDDGYTDDQEMCTEL